MKAPFSWLKDYVDIDVSAQELAEKLLSATTVLFGLSVDHLGAKAYRTIPLPELSGDISMFPLNI